MALNWQLGFRFPTNRGSDYKTPYMDLPLFSASEQKAYEVHTMLSTAFPLAEWRLIEVR